MVQFSSKPPFRKKFWESDRVYTFVDLPQHNPTNPILLARRNNPGEPIYYRNLERWPTWEEVEHARKVLTRRKAVFG